MLDSLDCRRLVVDLGQAGDAVRANEASSFAGNLLAGDRASCLDEPPAVGTLFLPTHWPVSTLRRLDVG
jgi:hypothetical protein